MRAVGPAIEINRTIDSYFLIDEEMMRRLIEECSQRLSQSLQPGDHPVTKYEMRLRDETLLNGEDLEDIFDSENGGPRAIAMLDLRWSDQAEEPSCLTRVKLDLGSRDDFKAGEMHHHVQGPRDWAKICAGEVGERLERARRSNFVRAFTTPQFWALFVIAVFAVMFVPMIMAIYDLDGRTDDGLVSVRVADAGTVEDAINVDDLSTEEAVKLALQLQLAASAGTSRRGNQTPGAPAPGVMVLLLVAMLGMAVSGAFRRQIIGLAVTGFRWGDQGAEIDRRIGRWRLLWTGVVLALIVGVGGSVIATYIRPG